LTVTQIFSNSIYEEPEPILNFTLVNPTNFDHKSVELGLLVSKAYPLSMSAYREHYWTV